MEGLETHIPQPPEPEKKEVPAKEPEPQEEYVPQEIRDATNDELRARFTSAKAEYSATRLQLDGVERSATELAELREALRRVHERPGAIDDTACRKLEQLALATGFDRPSAIGNDWPGAPLAKHLIFVRPEAVPDDLKLAPERWRQILAAAATRGNDIEAALGADETTQKYQEFYKANDTELSNFIDSIEVENIRNSTNQMKLLETLDDLTEYMRQLRVVADRRNLNLERRRIK